MAANPSNLPADTPIALTGAQETLLITLRAKYLDFYHPRPLLADRWAVAVLDHFGPRLRTPSGLPVPITLLRMRTRTIDEVTSAFLTRHRDAPVAVVHLACGLDARALRLREKCGVDVRWIDLDLPDVIDARRRMTAVLPEPPAVAGGGGKYAYNMVAADVTTTEWLEDLGADRPTLVIMEGLLMYLSVADAEALVQRLVDRFAPCGGEIVFDALSPLYAALQRRTVRRPGSFDVHVGYAAGSPADVLKLDKRLQLVKAYTVTDNPAVKLLGFWPRLALWLVSWIPYAGTMNRWMVFEM
ncbi:Tetracenomycin polyketide synthesis O-methyltransferase TcmP [Beauveria bassiana]|nr:Tetracenomycin polyketide synthesis O-methyltransferase TcmP [Beauveria bassiana]KAH8713196.1 Tetracenomycin polyketide synthesis O-methyltransferase TcmP [Beauveria bassiana]